ncbi:MAG: hypothetical protein VX421_04985 [Pseudomonadota bacterium]|nr:hypothetical protein [Pseudomonadota bacterium]
MSKSIILKVLFAIAVIGGAMLVIYQDEPAAPTGDINRIEPLPKQDNP